MLVDGVMSMPSDTIFFSAAYDQADIDATVRGLQRLQRQLPQPLVTVQPA
ncbi:hypothetical protein ACF073_09190 [Streptomyces sp. NPDC015171]